MIEIGSNKDSAISRQPGLIALRVGRANEPSNPANRIESTPLIVGSVKNRELAAGPVEPHREPSPGAALGVSGSFSNPELTANGAPLQKRPAEKKPNSPSGPCSGVWNSDHRILLVGRWLT